MALRYKLETIYMLVKFAVPSDVRTMFQLSKFDLYFYIAFLPEASIGLRVLSSPGCVCVCVNFFVRAITHLTFQLESSNLDQKIQQILLKVPIVFGVD